MRSGSWSPKAYISLLLGVCCMLVAALSSTPAKAQLPFSLPEQDSSIGILIEPSDSSCAVGDTIRLKIKITNNGTAALRNVLVFGTALGYLTDDLFPNTNSLAKNASANCNYDYQVTAADIDTTTNAFVCKLFVLGARGTGRNTKYLYNMLPFSLGLVDGNDGSDGDENEAGIKITKKADREVAYPGDVIRYTIKICNTGDVKLVKVRVDDDLYEGNLTEAFFPCHRPRTLDEGEELVFCYDYTVRESDIGTLVNKAKVGGIPLVRAETLLRESDCIYDTDEACVRVVPNPLQVTKIADRGSARPGAIIKYTIKIKNTGEDTLRILNVKDDVLGNLCDIFFPRGKARILCEGESITRTVSYKIKCNDPDPLINTVVVTACAEEEQPSGVTTPAIETTLPNGPSRVITARAYSVVKRCSAGGGTEPGQRPYADMIIYNSAYKNCTGDNIYDNSGRCEAMVQSVCRGQSISFPLRIENDTLCNEEIIITGSDNCRGWSVRYFDASNGGKDITDEITSERGWNPADGCGSGDELRALRARDFLVVITPNSGVSSNTVEKFLITATIRGSNVCDTVQAVVKVK